MALYGRTGTITAVSGQHDALASLLGLTDSGRGMPGRRC